MKRLLSISVALMLAISLQAQSNVTSFMGVPVNGSKTKVIQQLKSKGLVAGVGDIDMMGVVDGRICLVNILTHKSKAYRIMVIEKDATTDVNAIIKRYNNLIETYRNDSTMTEYEYNRAVTSRDMPFYEDYIHSGVYYAEFFQKSGEPELYDRRVSFEISDEFGGFRIVTCYDNIHNMPEGDNE